jgi:hypothetical protein
MGFEPHAAARLRLMALTAADPSLRAELSALVRRESEPAEPLEDASGEPCPACAAAHARALARANAGSSGTNGRPAVARHVPGLTPGIPSRR